MSGPLDLTVTVQPLKSEPLYDLSSPPPWFSDDPRQQPAEEQGLVGPWEFHLSVPLHPAVTATPGLTVEGAGVPITLEMVRITETSIRVQLQPDLADVRTHEFSNWSVEGTIRHGNGPAQALGWRPISPEWTGQPIGPEVLSILQADEGGSIVVQQTSAERIRHPAAGRSPSVG